MRKNIDTQRFLADSTPVSCSKKGHHPPGGVLFLRRRFRLRSVIENIMESWYNQINNPMGGVRAYGRENHLVDCVLRVRGAVRWHRRLCEKTDPSLITDVRQYNRENGIMWQLYSLWYFAAGLAEIWSTILALVILILGCLVGSGLLICHYNRICKKYRVR